MKSKLKFPSQGRAQLLQTKKPKLPSKNPQSTPLNPSFPPDTPKCPSPTSQSPQSTPALLPSLPPQSPHRLSQNSKLSQWPSTQIVRFFMEQAFENFSEPILTQNLPVVAEFENPGKLPVRIYSIWKIRGGTVKTSLNSFY
jgi:hypothetical protein